MTFKGRVVGKDKKYTNVKTYPWKSTARKYLCLSSLLLQVFSKLRNRITKAENCSFERGKLIQCITGFFLLFFSFILLWIEKFAFIVEINMTIIVNLFGLLLCHVNANLSDPKSD